MLGFRAPIRSSPSTAALPMRRFPLCTALFGAALFLITLGGWLFRHRPEPLPVLRLADGSVLRVEGLAWSGRPLVQLEPGWMTSAKLALPAGWPPLFGMPVGHFMHVGRDGLTLALSWYQPPSNSYLRSVTPDVTHVGSNGANHPAAGSWNTSWGRVTSVMFFPQISWRDERLRFRVRDGTNELEFSLPNPRRGEVFPQWTPEPLPQARSVDEFQFTLASLKPVENPKTPDRPAWTPELRIRRGGTDVTGWFGLSHVFVDPTGNRCDERLAANEPVWRVHVTAVPTLDFPFPATAISVRHAGPVPGPGEFLRLPASSGAVETGLDAVWLTGPGCFEFRAGANVSATASAGPIQERLDPWSRGVVRYAAQEPQLWWRSQVTVADETDDSPRFWQPRVRRADGRPVELKPLRSPAGEDSVLAQLPNGVGFRRDELRRYQLPADLVGESITVEVICLVPLRAEFTVAAPKLR